MAVKAYLIRKSTKSIIKTSDYPREDMLPVQGLDPDYEWFIEHIPFGKPDYDPRTYVLIEEKPDLNFLADFEEHPSYAGVREYRITYNTEKRPNEDILVELENAETTANDALFQNNTHIKEMAIALSATIKKGQSLVLNELEESKIEQLNAISVKFLKNAETKELKKQDLLNGLDIDLDEGWEKSL